MEHIRQKTCRECNETKPITEFHKHKDMADGHLNKCKTCVCARVRKHRKQNIERIREYDRNRPNAAERSAKSVIANREKYHSDPDFRESVLSSKREWVSRNNLKRRAHVMTGNAIKYGHLKRQPCDVCGEENSDAHHEDYRYPLKVRWLCRSCHMARHREINQEIRDGVDWSHKGF